MLKMKQSHQPGARTLSSWIHFDFFFGFSLYKYFFAVDKLIYISTYDPKEAE